MDADLKQRLIQKVLDGKAEIFTSPVASPTGFPFKVAPLDGTLSDKESYATRKRICDLGALRSMYKKEDGTVGYRCSAEPVEDYIRKGGKEEDTVGRACLCNTLLATAGFPQRRKDGYLEQGLITAGDDLVSIGHFLAGGKTSYTAADVINYLLGTDLTPEPAL